MKHLILSLTLLSFASTKYTAEDIKNEYSKVFQIVVHEYEGRTSISKEVSELPSEHFLHGFVKENYWLIHYFQTNGTAIKYEKLHELEEKPEELSDYYHRSLMADEKFNALLVPLVNNYLASQGIELIDYSGETKKIITADELIRVAVRFFYPLHILESGKIQSRICVGSTGLNDFEGERNVSVEAFCFETIFKELGSRQYGILDEYTSIIKQAKNLQLSTDAQTKLSRVQGAAWVLLSVNPKLKELLSSAYQKKKHTLPFVVEGLGS